MPSTETRGYSATKEQLLMRLRRIEGQIRGVELEKTDELMAAIGRLMRRG